MNKMLKTIIIGGAIYEGCNLMFDLGKAHMLGNLAKYNIEPIETIDMLESDERFRSRFIAKCAKIFKLNEKSR